MAPESDRGFNINMNLFIYIIIPRESLCNVSNVTFTFNNHILC